MKIYTKTGDKGTTSLFDGTRVSKDDPRLNAYGDVDELNSLMGVCGTYAQQEDDLTALIQTIQRDLFAMGAQLANPAQKKQKEKAAFDQSRIDHLEKTIDAFEEECQPLTSFILPGGCDLASFFHLARTVCRRAERRVIGLLGHDEEPSLLVIYLNRLSDLLFVAARVANKRSGVSDIPWDK